MGKRAIVLGASGLVGSELVRQLIADHEFESVQLFLRKKMAVNAQKVVQHLVDFDRLNNNEEKIKGDVVFCCLGTTIKKAGSQEAFLKVDKTYPLEFAGIAKKNKVPKFVLISSLGANRKSSNFYLKVKGETELGLENLRFDQLVIVRPSMLLGDRLEFRAGEMIGKALMKSLSFLFIGKLKKYKAIEAERVAKAMIVLSKSDLDEVRIFESDRLQSLGK